MTSILRASPRAEQTLCHLLCERRQRKRGEGSSLATLALLCCHMPGISQSVSNTSLTPPLQCLSLSLSRAFFHWKTKRTPKDEWRLESSFLHVPLRPSVYPSSQSLFSSSFFLCFSAKSHIDDHSFPANGSLPVSCQICPASERKIPSPKTREEYNASSPKTAGHVNT